MTIQRFQKALFFLPYFFVSFFVFFFISCNLFGQEGGIKFGKIDKEYLEMKTYEADTSANAVVLADYGSTYFRYHQGKEQFQIYFLRHRRIKILNNEGYGWADYGIPIYHSGGDSELISGLKGVTYNLVNGKVEKHKLEKNDIFDEKRSDNWDIKRFTMPNVTEGSVIEYTYTIISDFKFNLRKWEFQASIPTLWSEYSTSIPEYYYYKKIQQGYIPLALAENKTEPGSINFSDKNADGKISNRQITYINNVDRWGAKNVPAMVAENYMTTVNDYISKIEFELATVKFPNSPVESVMNTWETLNKQLLQSQPFGDQLNKKAFIKNQAAAIAIKHQDPEGRIKAAVGHIKNKMNWNGEHWLYSNGNIRKSYEEGTGNSADINLTLIVLLRGLGMDANPVILSTRGHGMVNPVYPLLSKFNHVIAHVAINDKSYLLDATDKLQPYNQLPFECLNGRGRLISKAGTHWVTLRSTESSNNFTSVSLHLNEENEYVGKIQSSCTGYDAYMARKKITKSGKEAYIKDKVEVPEGLSLEEFTISNLDEPGRAMLEEYEVNVNQYVMNAGKIVYIDPLLMFAEDENPMKQDTRYYPVDLGCPIASSYRLTIPIPEGFRVEEVPEPALISLPNKGGIFRYSVSSDGSNLTLITSYHIKQTLFLPEEYGIIKQFFDILVAKHAEKIVLKKNT